MAGSTNGDASWPERGGHSVELGVGVEPLAELIGPTATLDSSPEATGLVRRSFLEAALVLGYGPNVCSIWSTRATNAVETPTHVPGLNSVFMSPQVPCRLRAARSRTKGSTSVWRPTLQAHATRPLPTCMCEVRTRAVPGPIFIELSCPCRACRLEPLVWTQRGLPWAQSFLYPTSFCSSHDSSNSSHWASS